MALANQIAGFNRGNSGRNHSRSSNSWHIVISQIKYKSEANIFLIECDSACPATPKIIETFHR